LNLQLIKTWVVHYPFERSSCPAKEDVKAYPKTDTSQTLIVHTCTGIATVAIKSSIKRNLSFLTAAMILLASMTPLYGMTAANAQAVTTTTISIISPPRGMTK
jgi:hypothetical protein